MQYIEQKQYIPKIFQDINSLYRYTSVIEHTTTLLPSSFSDCFKSLIDLFNEHAKTSYNVSYKHTKYKRIKSKRLSNNGRAIVCFSGGKDSLATVLRLKEQGYQVWLYHLKGINQTYKDEYKTAERIAEMLGVPLISEEIKLKGSHEWTEHPMKNMIIANNALWYGIRNNITVNIYFGNFLSSSVYTDSFEVCGGDCKEMWSAYEKIIQQVIPNWHMGFILNNFQDTIETLVRHKEYLSFVQSCIGPYRYREYLHKNNQTKYGIELPEHRCGSCWKCCLEYIVFCDYEVYTYNQEYYKHCLEILKKTLQKENRIKLKRLEDVWHEYCFYDIGKSKYFSLHLNKCVV